MPHKAFLKKKSLLDRFKDDHALTGFIQSARAKHTWDNPITRRKRTKELNGWIKSFAGKRHIHKLARFNALQAGKYEDANSNLYVAYHISPTKFEKFRLMPKSGMGTTFYGRGIYLTYDKSVIDYYKNLLADYYDTLYIYTVNISPKAKIISEDEIFDYIDDSVDLEDSEQVANLLKTQVDGIRYYNDEDGNSVVIFNADLVSIKNIQEWSMKNEKVIPINFNLCYTFDLNDELAKKFADGAKGNNKISVQQNDGYTDVFFDKLDDLVDFLDEVAVGADSDKVDNSFRYAVLNCKRSKIDPADLQPCADKYGVKTKIEKSMNQNGLPEYEVTLYKDFDDVSATLVDFGF